MPRALRVPALSAFAVLVLLAAACAQRAHAASRDDGGAELTFAGKDPELPRVVVVSTGGTIAERAAHPGGAVTPSLSGKDVVALVPGLDALANVAVVEYSNVDSSHMTPKLWAGLSKTVDELLAREDVAGVVVTHGTDTMAEGAYFLDLTLRSDKPVVFTGAMNAASSAFPDGPSNILDAVVQVLSPAARGWGVTITLNRYVNSARAARKTQTTNPQTFEPGEKGYLGYVVDGKVQRFNERVGRQRLPLVEPLPRVTYLVTFAGDDGSLIRHAVADEARGLVIDALGAGNVDGPVLKAIQAALDAGVVVVIGTRVPRGSVEPSYGDVGGGADLAKRGCILAGDLDGPKARLLLMLGLAAHGPKRAEIAAHFVTGN